MTSLRSLIWRRRQSRILSNDRSDSFADAVAASPAAALPEPIPSPSPVPSATATPAAGPAPGPATTSVRLKVAKTEGTGANLRERPASDGKVVAILMDGTSVDVVGEDVKVGAITWRNVRTVGSTTDGVTGWVSAQFLMP